jgi:hypothetical protein
VGTRVVIRYDPTNVTSAEVASDISPTWILVIIFCPLGLALLGAGLMFSASRRNETKVAS